MMGFFSCKNRSLQVNTCPVSNILTTMMNYHDLSSFTPSLIRYLASTWSRETIFLRNCLKPSYNYCMWREDFQLGMIAKYCFKLKIPSVIAWVGLSEENVDEKLLYKMHICSAIRPLYYISVVYLLVMECNFQQQIAIK